MQSRLSVSLWEDVTLRVTATAAHIASWPRAACILCQGPALGFEMWGIRILEGFADSLIVTLLNVLLARVMNSSGFTNEAQKMLPTSLSVQKGVLHH